MTRQKSFKRRVRARMEKTGESYTAARRMLIADGDVPAQTAEWVPPSSEESLREATGRGWDEWHAIIDEAGVADAGHTAIAKYLREEQGVAGWWSQNITVGFERARGIRALGQRADGVFSVTATKTVNVPMDRLVRAFAEDERRAVWTEGADMTLRKGRGSTASLRFDWEDGETRVIAGFESLDGGKSRVALEHERLPGVDAMEAMRPYWRERLSSLKEALENA